MSPKVGSNGAADWYIKSFKDSILKNSVCFLFSLKNLKSLRFDGCHLRSIPTRAFWGLSNLVSLTVATRNAGVLTIEAGAFAGLNSLEQLDLSGNYIRHLAPGVLCSLPKLTVLNLSKNEIGSLSDLGLLEVSTYLLAGLEKMHLQVEKSMYKFSATHIGLSALS